MQANLTLLHVNKKGINLHTQFPSAHNDMRIQWGNRGCGPPPPPLKNHKIIRFLSKFGPDPLKSYEPAFKVGLSSARQRNAIEMASQ